MSLLIKNIQLIDGTGKSAAKTDVLVKNERIASIGNLSKYKARETIDGRGAYLAPGFIDINTTADRYLNLFSDPSQKSFLLQGVTTIIGGLCGISLAPLLYGSLRVIRERTGIKKINVNWHTFGEFMKVLSKKASGINFGTFIGERTIRHDIAGDSQRELTPNEFRVFKLILERALKEGAFGLSLGQDYSSSKISYEQIREAVRMTAKLKSVCGVHLPDYKQDVLSSVNEVVNLAKDSGARTLISHLEPIKGFEENYIKSVKLIESNTARADVYFDIHPNDLSTVPILELLPAWIKESGRVYDILKQLENPEIREKVIEELPKFKGEDIIILSAPGHGYLAHKSIKTFSHNRNLKMTQGLLVLIEITEARAIVSYRNINSKEARRSILSDRAIIASASASFLGTEESVFTQFLKLSEKEKILPLETAIYKITGLPAQVLGLKDRGVVRAGYFADLTLFRDGEIREVILNGKRVVKDGEYQNILAGKILKHKP